MLEGLNVLEVGRLLPAPLMGTILLDLGATVTKLEPWPQGEPTRGTALFDLLHRGKRFLALVPQQWPEVWPHLLSQVDILILNHLPPTLERMGLSPEKLNRLAPHLITINLMGHADGRPGHDLNFLAESGVLDRLRLHPHTPPIVPGFLLGDLLGGTATGLIRLLAALYARQRTGLGTYLPIHITTEMLRWSYATAFLYKSGNGVLPPPSQDLFSGALPAYRLYRTQDDRYIAVAALEPKHWEAFCRHVGRLDLLPHGFAMGDPEAHAAVEALFAEKSFAQWEQLLDEANLCVTPVYTFTEALQRPWAQKAWDGQYLHFAAVTKASQTAKAPGADNEALWSEWKLPSHLRPT